MNTKKLESWYLEHHVAYPFRQTNHPYHIWVSEIMLQQTQMDTVIPYYERFIQLFPDIASLAVAHDDLLKKTVEGIGYYRRFKLMKQAAIHMMEKHDGVFPTLYEDVIKLPGIGTYTAGAIMSIAYGKPYSAVDGNVIRIISRQYLLDQDMRQEKHKRLINGINQQLIMHANPKDYTQALMDLGRTICKPKHPQCELCPVAETCQAYASSRQEQLPFLSKLNQTKSLSYIVLIIHTRTGIVLRKRTESLLEGMYEYPQFEYDSIQAVIDLLDQQGVIIDLYDEPVSFKHVFTHQTWHMHVYSCRLIGNKLLDDWQVYRIENIKKLPMAIAHRKIRG